MRKIGIIIRRWLIRIVIAVGVIIGVQLSVLAFPYPFFSHKAEFENCTVYSDIDMSDELDDIMNDVGRRLKGVELYTPDKHSRVFVCHSRSLFAFFARLSLLHPHIQGFGLSIFGNSFISVPRVNELRRERAEWPPYSIVDGGLAHVIVHEIVHEYIADEIGYIGNYRASYMKKEGYVEYSAHRALCAADTAVTLSDKIEMLEYDGNWRPHDYVRSVYRATLVMEYLSEIKGYRFADVMHDSVVIESAYRDMLAWYAVQLRSSGSN